jgi:beta-mannosidase
MRQIGFIITFFLPQFLWSQQVIEKEITDWEFRMVGDSVWEKAIVPGTIIDNFVDLSDISNPLHPYYGNNEKLYQWIAEKDWEFRSYIAIQVPHSDYFQGHTEIEFECLDLFADVYINGKKWHHENAFYPLNCAPIDLEVEDFAMTAKAEIRVVIHSPLRQLQQFAAADSLKYPGGERVYARKPQYEFGWDWGPQFLNIGIRKPVICRMYASHSLGMKTELKELRLSENLASLKFDIACNTSMVDFIEIHTLVKLDSEIVYQSSELKQLDIYKKAGLRIGLNNPQLWWPNGSGKPTYYTFEIWITNSYKEILDKEVFQIPLCEIQLVQEKDKSGETFYFKVNGERVYAKGANYVPDDSFHPGKNTSELVRLAKDGNMNMIRVWGGGTYPNDEFYIECMKNGIMVWQDLMFACAMYPSDDTSLYNYAQEAEYISQRLNKFKNIAVWCGNNENEEGWNNWGWQKELKMSEKDSSDISTGNKILFRSILPGVLDGDHHNKTQHADYIPTSPKHGWGRKESMTDGDAHYWGVWWGLESIETYQEKIPQFMSEFGMQSMPNMETLKKVIPDSAINFNSPKFNNHQKHPTGFQTLDHYLKKYLVIPDSMDDYAYATQLLQTYALTIAIEAQRRAMPYCMGSLIWQLNDCWPVTSWSLVDSELKKKIAYYEVKQVFKPLKISVKEEKESYEIYVTNDAGKTPLLDFVIYIKNFYGEVIRTKKASSRVNENSSNSYVSIPKSNLTGIDLTTIYMYSYIQESEKIKNKTYLFYDENYFHFVRPNQLKLPVPEFKIITDSYGTVLKTNVYCPYIMLPSFLKNEGAYLGTVQAGTRNISSHGNAEYLQWLSTNTSKIKCLNTLLDHPR